MWRRGRGHGVDVRWVVSQAINVRFTKSRFWKSAGINHRGGACCGANSSCRGARPCNYARAALRSYTDIIVYCNTWQSLSLTPCTLVYCPLVSSILNVTPVRLTNQRCESSATCSIYSSSVVRRSRHFRFSLMRKYDSKQNENFARD